MVKSKLLIVSILVISIVSLFVIPVFAEVNTDSLVNFNQYFNSTINQTESTITLVGHGNYITINGHYSSLSVDTRCSVNIIAGHKYYFKFNSNKVVLYFDGGMWLTALKSIQTFNTSSNPILYLFINDSYDNLDLYINIIDLTYMFGAGNEPTLTECESLFPTYYYYNDGEVLSFLAFDSYNKGVQSVYDSLSYSLNSSSSYNSFDSAYVINYAGGNIIGETTSQSLNYPVYPPTHGEYILQPTYYQLAVNKFGRMNLGVKINQGSTVKVSGLLSRYNLNSATKVHVGVLSYQNDFISIYSIDLPALPENKLVNYINFSFDVQMPIDTDSLYFYIDGLKVSSSNTYFYLGDIQVETKNLNTQFLIDKSYNDGYDLGFNQGSESSYNNGYNAGYNKGLESANQNTFLTLFTSVIEAPVNAVLSIFDFEVLGYNLKGFFVGLFSMALLLAIIRLFI